MKHEIQLIIISPKDKDIRSVTIGRMLIDLKPDTLPVMIAIHFIKRLPPTF